MGLLFCVHVKRVIQLIQSFAMRHFLFVYIVLKSHVLLFIFAKLVLNFPLPSLSCMIVSLTRFLLCKVQSLKVFTLLQKLLNLTLKLALISLSLVSLDAQLMPLMLQFFLVSPQFLHLSLCLRQHIYILLFLFFCHLTLKNCPLLLYLSFIKHLNGVLVLLL
jgi:hypothetical protein